MPVQANSPVPYAPPASVMDTVRGYRDHGLTTPFTADVLLKAGISDSLIPRTLAALETLDFIDEHGNPTEGMNLLAGAAEAEFKDCLAKHIRAAYMDVFQFVDPANTTRAKVEDVFRAYSPRGQRGRMVTLFLGLCHEAGIIKEPLRRTGKRGPTGKTPHAVKSATTKRRQRKTKSDGLPPSIAGLIDSLPDPEQGWTEDERDKFVAAFRHMLDFAYPIIEKTHQKQEAAE